MATSVVMQRVLRSEEPTAPEGRLVGPHPYRHRLCSHVARVRDGRNILRVYIYIFYIQYINK